MECGYRCQTYSVAVAEAVAAFALFYSIGILFHESVPTRITLAGDDFSGVEKMADRSGQTISRIEVFRKLFQAQKLLQHFRYLFFARISVSGNRHLDLFGLVFGDRDLARQTRGHRYSLGASEFQHRLDILAKKRGFDRDFVRVMRFYEFDRAFENHFQFCVVIVVFRQDQFVELHETHGFPDDFDKSETHDRRAWIDSQYDAFVGQFSFLCGMVASARKAKKQYWIALAKILVLVGAFYYIWNSLAHNDKLDWQQFLEKFESWTWPSILLILVLSFLNRFLEIVKWQSLAGTIREISLPEATKQVLAALTAGLFTPNGIGEYAAKTLYFEKSSAKKIVFLNLVCNGIQMILSVLFGVFGLLYFNVYFHVITAQSVLFIFGIVCFVLLASFFFRKFTIKGFSIEKLVHKINSLPKKIHAKNTLLAICRYLVFSHQYFVLFRMFDVDLPYPILMAAITSTYFLASSLPTFQFLDFAVKGGVAVYFFGLLGVNEWITVFISTLMWFLNVVLPVSIGSYYVVKFKSRWSH